MRKEHPAASYDTLPGEVKGYISELTMEIYDRKQEIAGGIWFASSQMSTN
jgi:hypothetical protein